MGIPYNHFKNRHGIDGPRVVWPIIIGDYAPKSLLDVGCGLGVWSKAALELGVEDLLGLDGVQISSSQLLIPERCFKQQDFTQPWNLGRRFDVALCLEVAEHLDRSVASPFVQTLVLHSDVIVFSAAAPGQAGQHHVNCQWPSYWQKIFNSVGFSCDDSIRWRIWNEGKVEPWYRQNIFVARKDAQNAGREPRLRPVVHPEFLYGPEYETTQEARFSSSSAIERGGMTVAWYLRTPVVGLGMKLANQFKPQSRPNGKTTASQE
jgi:hypothetical protein